MESIRQCWAHSADGARCEHPAGHPGNHMISKEWGDDECFSPIRHQLPTPAPALPKTGMSDAPPPPPDRCVACGHAHKDGICKCGCYEYIG